jgi:tRNA threonylcarbamoyladenosine biosynthesis protein TsaE
MDCGKEIARLLKPSMIVALFGDLGAGKTTLIKGIVHALTQRATEEVCSPTYTYLNIYEGTCPIYHFDLYRLNHLDAFLHLGFDEYFCAGGVCCIEWSERIAPILPPHALHVNIEHMESERRKISYEIPYSPIY